MAFAEKMGWRFEVEDPQMRRLDRQKRFAGYGDNFRFVAFVACEGQWHGPCRCCICSDSAATKVPAHRSE